MNVRPHYLETVEKFEVFTPTLKAGSTSEEIKTAVIELLDPYVNDKKLLGLQAVSLLANEALCVANLKMRPEWTHILDKAFEIRNSAISVDRAYSFQIFCAFERVIREAQKKYSMQILFEQSKDGLNTEEYAFEMFRIIGGLIESTIQPFIKELYCLALIAVGQNPIPETVIESDFGKVIDQFERLQQFPALLTPEPWGIRINQWRNIAQHHSFIVKNETITASYGKSSPKKSVELSRSELFLLSKEFIRRLGALKTSRELTILNNIESLRPMLPPHESDIYGTATEMGAAFATQGFTLAKLEETERTVFALLIDATPQEGLRRQIHCSQFVLPIGSRFPGKNIQVMYESSSIAPKYSFSLSASAHEFLSKQESPFTSLANLLEWKKI